MNDQHDLGCGCGCDDACDRRDFLAAMSAAFGGLTFTALGAETAGSPPASPGTQQGARVRAVFLYPPSKAIAEKPDGWWTWPGNQFDAEGRQQQYMAAFREMEKRFGMRVAADAQALATPADAQRLIEQLQAQPPDGLLLIVFFNWSLKLADEILAAADKAKVPTILYIGLGVKHGQVRQYRRPGVYFIQSLDNFEAIAYGLRMINAKKLVGQRTLLSITEAQERREAVEPFLGTKVRVIPFARYAEEFHKVTIDEQTRRFIAGFTGSARELRKITEPAKENAARAHFALKKLLADEGADGVTMNCLRRGMLKPCVSFATLNNELIPAACENDLPAAYTQLLGQLLVGCPGFQHNPCYETERNHYYGSHCTCPTKLYGPAGPALPHLIRRFAHTNEGSCAVQVFWKESDPVTMVRYYPGNPPALDVYAGKVVASHPMPPAGGCTTNVEIELTDREDACMVTGHHNLLFCGDFARKFRLFAQLFRMKLVDSGFKGPWPV